MHAKRGKAACRKLVLNSRCPGWPLMLCASCSSRRSSGPAASTWCCCPVTCVGHGLRTPRCWCHAQDGTRRHACKGSSCSRQLLCMQPAQLQTWRGGAWTKTSQLKWEMQVRAVAFQAAPWSTPVTRRCPPRSSVCG